MGTERRTVSRISISLDHDLLASLDRLVASRRYANRSEAVRDLIRARLVEREWKGNKAVIGTITLLYDHHVRDLPHKLTSMQHESKAQVISTMHVHLDHHNCLEVVVVKGRSREVAELANALISARGVRHGELTASSLGRKI